MVARARLRQRPALQEALRRGRRASRRSEDRSTICANFRSPPRTICASNYPFGMFAMPREQIAAHPRLVGHHRQADRRRLQPARYRHLGRRLRALACAPRGGRPGMLVQNAYGYGLFTGGLGLHYGAERLGCTVVPVSGGMTERQVKLIGDFEPDIIFVTPSYMLAILDEFRAQGVDPRQSLAQDRHLRRRALDQRHARRNRGGLRHARHRHLRPVGSDRPGRRLRMRRDQGRPAHLGGSFLSGGHRSGDRRRAAGRRARRAGVHLADQGSDAGHPLSHARPDAACCPARRARCGAWRRSPAAPTT